jgi:WD40 repeat protein
MEVFSPSQLSLIYISDSSLNFSLLNTYHLDSEISPIQPLFPTGFHTKKINSISCSSCKSIFATCSEDNTVKIWNYYDSETTEKKGVMSQEFKEEPLCLSMHPSGLYIAICFTNWYINIVICNGVKLSFIKF